ncbi:MAG: branched-chain amino acid ABC transporter permease [Clostridia bacterium]|nr:branched-chain amino acid ABC transporter permease [Clostridia bacterium]
MAYFLNTVTGSLVAMCVTAMVTLAITLIFRTSFTTNFAQGVISAFGAYVASSVIMKAGVPIYGAIPIAVVVSLCLASLIDVGIFRRGRYVNALGKQIITMGLISVLSGLMPLIFGIQQHKIDPFIMGNITADIGDAIPFTMTKNSLICTAITVVVVAVVFILLRFSKWGLSVRATASNEYVAGMMGINTHIVTAVSWGIAGAIGALAAVMSATVGRDVSVYFMTDYQVTAFLAGILGGFSTFYGPVICAFIIPLLNNLIVYLFNVTGHSDLTAWSMVIVYAIALVIIFIKPQGIFGKRIAKKV